MRYSTFFLLPALAGASLVAIPPGGRAQDESPMRVIIYNTRPVARPALAPRPVYRPRQRYADRPKPTVTTPVPGQPVDPFALPEEGRSAVIPVQRGTILIAGDSLAEALALGLEVDDAFKAEFAVKSKTVSASGLVRDDFHDWPRVLELALREAPRPAAVLVMLGLNDRQILKTGNETHAPLTPGWREGYIKRIDRLIATARAAGVPLVWVGLPTMRVPALSSDLAQINTLIRDRVQTAGETFIETYDGFADASGGFTATGPDVIGDTVRLRGPDGIHFTPAGQRKLAFFVDKPLRKRLESLPGAPAAPAPPPAPAVGKAETVVSVPLPAPNATLAPQIPARIRPDIGEARPLGAAPAAAALAGTPPPHQDPAAEALFSQGISPTPKLGRADDFRWR